MKWNKEEIVKKIVDNCPDIAPVTIGLMNPKTFDKLFTDENRDEKFIAEGKKRIIIYKNEAIAEDYIVATYSNPDYLECIEISICDEPFAFPQSGMFVIPLIPEDE